MLPNDLVHPIFDPTPLLATQPRLEPDEIGHGAIRYDAIRCDAMRCGSDSVLVCFTGLLMCAIAHGSCLVSTLGRFAKTFATTLHLTRPGGASRNPAGSLLLLSTKPIYSLQKKIGQSSLCSFCSFSLYPCCPLERFEQAERSVAHHGGSIRRVTIECARLATLHGAQARAAHFGRSGYSFSSSSSAI